MQVGSLGVIHASNALPASVSGHDVQWTRKPESTREPEWFGKIMSCLIPLPTLYLGLGTTWEPECDSPKVGSLGRLSEWLHVSDWIPL